MNRNFGHEFPEKMQHIFPKPGARGWGKGGQKLFGVFLEIHPLLREETMGQRKMIETCLLEHPFRCLDEGVFL